MNMFTCSLCAALAISTYSPSNLCAHCSRYVGTAGRLPIPWHRTAGKLDSITSKSVYCCTHRIKLHINTPWVPFPIWRASALWCKLKSHLQFDEKHPLPHGIWQTRKSLGRTCRAAIELWSGSHLNNNFAHVAIMCETCYRLCLFKRSSKGGVSHQFYVGLKWVYKR